MTTEGSWFDFLSEHREMERQIRERARSLLQLNPSSDRRARERVELENCDVRFRDPFSSGTVKIGMSEGYQLHDQQKIAFYGTDWSEVGEAALAWVSHQGFPTTTIPLLNSYTTVTDGALIEILPKIAKAAMQSGEGTEEWLCFCIYFRALELSNLFTTEATQGLIFDSTFILGGLVRELELSYNHKRDSLSRKRAIKALNSSNSANDERKHDAQLWKAHAAKIRETIDTSKHSQANVARLILRYWQDGSDFIPQIRAHKTIVNWLSEKTSQPRSGSGRSSS